MPREPLDRNNVSISGKLDSEITLLFVNGIGTTQRAWSEVAKPFEERFRIVRFDHVGSVAGNLADFQSNKVRYLDAKGYAKDLLEICSALRLSRNTIAIGHSLGGLAALLASIERPGQFSKLVLLGVSPRYANAPGYEGGFTKEAIHATYDALAADYSAWRKTLSQGVIQSPHRQDLVEEFAGNLAVVPPDMMLTVLCSVLQTDHRADLDKVTCPSLIVHSQDDIFVPGTVSEFMQSHLPMSTLVRIEARGHLPHLTHPQQVIQAIREFLDTEHDIRDAAESLRPR